MERSRPKRGYNYDPDSSPPPPPRSRPRYNDNRRRPNHHHRRGGSDDRRPQHPPPPPPFIPPAVGTDGGPPPGAAVTTFYRILCPDYKCEELLGEPIGQIQAQTHAWITVHRPTPGDSERVIETSDNVRREPDGRPPQFSPAQDALLLVHRKIVDMPDCEDVRNRDRDRDRERGDDEDGLSKVTSRMVIPRLHVGCLLGRGGHIIEQMRKETKTHIRILPRDHNTPGCVSMSEEILQVVGELNPVKRAIAIISDRLKESLHRDRSSFRERDRQFPSESDYIPSTQHLPAIEERYFDGPDRPRNEFDSNGGPFLEYNNEQVNSYEAIVFRILCPSEKVDVVMGGPPHGILDMLRSDVGVDVMISDPVAGCDEKIVVVTSQEGPDNELFPAQEALLHIQTHIVDLGPDKDNVITTRLLVPSKEIGCFEGRDGLLSEIKKSSSVNVQILPKEDLPMCALDSDELIQIVGEIRAARNALVQITANLKSYLFRDAYEPNYMPQAPYPGPNNDVISTSIREVHHRGENAPMAAYPRTPLPGGPWHPKDVGGSASGSFEQEASNGSDDLGRQNSLKRVSVPIVTRSTLEVVIPKIAVEILVMRSKNKLAQISQISGATVNLVEDTPDTTDGVVKISGSPEQADKAQSLLQGFILSIQDDIP